MRPNIRGLFSIFIGVLFFVCLINSSTAAQMQPTHTSTPYEVVPEADSPWRRGDKGEVNPINTSDNELTEAERVKIISQFGNVPAYFIENQGQTADEVKYYFKGNDTVYFTDEGVVFRKTVGRGTARRAPTGIAADDVQPATFKSLAYRLDFVGAEPTAPEARNKQKAKVAYFKGNDRSKWHNDIPTYQEIVYPGLYPSMAKTGWHGQIHPNKWRTRQSFGRARLSVSDEIVRHGESASGTTSPSLAKTETGGIDLVYKGVPGGMKYEFIVQPGADPDVVKLAYTGIEGLSIDDTGNLIIQQPSVT